MDPTKFRAHLAAEMGKKAADLATVAPDARTGREHDEEGRFTQTGHDVPNGDAQEKKAKRLRAILWPLN